MTIKNIVKECRLGVVGMRVNSVGDFEGVVKEMHVEKKDTQQTQNASQMDVEDAIRTVQKKLKKFREVLKSEAEFQIDRSTGMVIVKIKDKDTGQIIRQIPPDVVVKLAKTIDEFLGMLLDERA